jgi:hypothetical protein
MLDKKELRRLARLHRLARQIAASLPAEIYSAHALREVSPRARAGACEIASARSVLLGIRVCWLAAALRLGGLRTPIVASPS